VLAVFSAANTFSEDDEILLGNIAAQLATAEENHRLNQDVERTYIDTIAALALAVEAKDPYSAGHSKRVGYYAERIAEIMGLDEETCLLIREGGVLHDVGKIGIKDAILLKPAPLNDEEQLIMHQHPVIGEAILKPLRSLRRVAEMVRHHHERYDGQGYPDGLKGEAIPLAGRILLVADAYDSMVTDRPYRKRLSDEVAKQELLKGRGTHFDPGVVDAALKMIEERASGKVRPEDAFKPRKGHLWSPYQHSLAGKLPQARPAAQGECPPPAFDNDRD
jgi:putative nucleotidyltransferase with HDIG domain